MSLVKISRRLTKASPVARYFRASAAAHCLSILAVSGRHRESNVAASLTENGRGGEARMSRIIQEETAPEILAHFLAQNVADYARMMPFNPTDAEVNR